MQGKLLVVAAALVAAACSDTIYEVQPATSHAPQFSRVPRSAGNYTAGNVDIVSPFVTPSGEAIRDQYKYEAWRVDALSPVQGTFHHHTDTNNGNTTVFGDILCFTIVGNRARIGGIVRHSNSPDIPVGSELTWSVTDNTEARKGDPRDTASPMLGADAELYCALGLPYPESPVEKNKWVEVER